MEFLHILFQLIVLFLKLTFQEFKIAVDLSFSFELILVFLKPFGYLSYTFFLTLDSLFPFSLRLKKVRMVGQPFLYFLQNPLRIFIFQYHPPHFNVELAINLALHLFIHRLHKLLDDIFYVLDIPAIVELLLKTFVQRHHVGVLAESDVVGAPGMLLFVYGFKYLQDQPDHAVLASHADQLARLHFASEEEEHLLGKIVQNLIHILVSP